MISFEYDLVRGEKQHTLRVFFSRTEGQEATMTDPAYPGETGVEQVWLVPLHNAKDAPRNHWKRVDRKLTPVEAQAIYEAACEQEWDDDDYADEEERQEEFRRQYWLDAGGER